MGIDVARRGDVGVPEDAAEQLAAGPRWKNEDFVFTGGRRQGRYFVPDGRPLDAGYVLRQFQAAMTAANLPSQPFHALRPRLRDALAEQGEELGVISSTGLAGSGGRGANHLDIRPYEDDLRRRQRRGRLRAVEAGN